MDYTYKPQISRPCPICMTDDSAFYFENTMATVGGFDMSYTVVSCNHCGFYYAKQLADPSTFSAYYQSVSKYDSFGPLSVVDQARIDFAVGFLEGRIDKNARIADLGCGKGALLGGLQRGGWQRLQGLDPAPNAAQLGLEMYGVSNIHRGTLSNAHDVIDLKEINLVCIMSVLEHLPNLKHDLKRLLTHLPLGCKILLEVPAIEFFLNPRSEPFGEFSLEHIQYFDVPSLNNLMFSLGAEPLALDLLDLPMVASGAILGLFEWRDQAPAQPTYKYWHSNDMDIYKQQSQRKLDLALNRIPAGPLILYGAGSHTARLLAHLEKMSICNIHSIVDSNPNLVGKKLGRWTVKTTDDIHQTPEIPVLVSSYRSQNAIASALNKSAKNPIILMYQ